MSLHAAAVRGKEHKNARGDKSVWNDKLPFLLLSSSSDSFFLSVPLLIPLYHTGARVATTDSYHPCDRWACTHNTHTHTDVFSYVCTQPLILICALHWQIASGAFLFIFLLMFQQIECFPFSFSQKERLLRWADQYWFDGQNHSLIYCVKQCVIQLLKPGSSLCHQHQ